MSRANLGLYLQTCPKVLLALETRKSNGFVQEPS